MEGGVECKDKGLAVLVTYCGMCVCVCVYCKHAPNNFSSDGSAVSISNSAFLGFQHFES